MASDEEIKVMIQSLQDQIKYGQEVNNELRHDIDNQIRQQKALSNDNDYLRQKISAIQLDNSNYSNTQARLETQLYAQEQDMSKLRKEIQQLSKAKRDAEKKLIAESEEYENDKSVWQQREADLYNQIRSLSVTNSLGEPRTPRTPRRRSVTASTLGIMSPFTSGLGDIGELEAKLSDNENNNSDDALLKPTPKLAVIDSSYAREAKIAQRTIKAQDKMILDLKNEVDKQKSLLQEQQSASQLISLKVVHLEHEIANVKQLNRSLMEDNESYQILLHEKTINGEFMMNPIMQVEDHQMKESISSTSNGKGGGLNLADELASSIPDWNNQKEAESDQTIQKLNEEVKMLQDTNRALQLYMNKILMKIINNKQLEDVLSIDQPTKQKEQPTLIADSSSLSSSTYSNGGGPTPTKTVSTAVPTNTTPLNNNSANGTSNSANRQRRRTISYWGSKVPPPPPSKANAEQELSVDPVATAEERRRHSSIVPNKSVPQPEKSVSTSTTATNGGWAKALRRMSVIGWSSVKEESTTPTNVINNDSAVGSLSEEEEKTSLENSRKSSRSSTPSLRRSNELGTLAEED